MLDTPPFMSSRGELSTASHRVPVRADRVGQWRLDLIEGACESVALDLEVVWALHVQPEPLVTKYRAAL